MYKYFHQELKLFSSPVVWTIFWDSTSNERKLYKNDTVYLLWQDHKRDFNFHFALFLGSLLLGEVSYHVMKEIQTALWRSMWQRAEASCQWLARNLDQQPGKWILQLQSNKWRRPLGYIYCTLMRIPETRTTQLSCSLNHNF